MIGLNALSVLLIRSILSISVRRCIPLHNGTTEHRKGSSRDRPVFCMQGTCV